MIEKPASLRKKICAIPFRVLIDGFMFCAVSGIFSTAVA
jgi:hypothetical protein